MLRAVSVFAALALVGCPPGDDDDSSTPDPGPQMRLWTPALDGVDQLGAEFECRAANPEVRWDGVPDGAVSLALIFDDPSGGGRPFPHWGIYGIPPDADGIPRGASGPCAPAPNLLPDGAVELVNIFDTVGFHGPCTCVFGGTHSYRWRLWALSADLEDPVDGNPNALAQFQDLERQAEAARIAIAEFAHDHPVLDASACGTDCDLWADPE